MTAFRRAWLASLAALLLVFAFGSFTEALACATACPTADHRGCDHARVDSCAVTCHALCSAAAPAAPAADAPELDAAEAFSTNRRRLEANGLAPDPPPPRA